MIATLYEDGKASAMRLFTVADSQPVLGETIYSCSVNDDGEETVTTFDRVYTMHSSTKEYVPSTDSVKTKGSISWNGWTVINSESVSDFYGRTTGKQFTLNLSEEEHHSFGTEYIYDDTETTATNRISRVKNTLNGAVDSDYAYTYDNRGNILTVSKSGTLFQQYVYDEASQLKTEYNYAEKTAMTYVYDANGNIVSKTPYTNVTSSDLSTATQGTSIVYGYGDSNWSDKLTSYDGQTISYDESGNPTSYKGDNITWNGRLMTSYTKGERRYEFAYNSDGMRTVKRAYENGELVYTYTYIWDGDVLLGGRMENDEGVKTTVRYLYDDSGELYGMDYNGKGYFAFIKNLQGDIVSIVPLDSENDSKVNIEYDAWGKPIIGQTSSAQEKLLLIMMMAVTNVAYRSYFYDFDIGLYYLRSRYYDPETGRFINADDLENCKPPKLNSLLPFHKYYDMNVFAYGQNNPINNEDSKGTVSKSIKKNEAWGDFYLAIVMFASYEYTQVKQSKKKGKIMVDFNHVDKGTYFYDVIDFYNKNYKGNIYDYIAYGALAKFKDSYELSSGKKPNRDFLFNDKCVSKEIEAHFKAYMWSMGKKSYYVPVYMYAYGVIQKGSAKAIVKSACKVADMIEADAEDNTGEAIAFGYYNGVRDKYKKTYKDPYYDKNHNKRRFSKNAYEGWSNLEF